MADVLGTDMNNVAIETLDNMWLPVFVRNHPFLDRLKRKQAGGSGYRIPIETGPGGGASSNFGNSLTNSASVGFTGDGFQIPPATQYGTTRIDWAQQRLSDTPQSPVEIASNSTKNAMELATENLANMLLGSSSGATGAYAVISSNVNTAGNIYRLVLTVPTDASKFNLEQVIVSKATATASLDASTAVVTGVNANGGAILVDGGGTWTPTNGHIIGLQGQLPSGSDTSGIFPSVLQWIPTAANRTAGVPGGTFLGVSRAEGSNVVAVSGWGWDGSSTPPFQALYAASGYMQNNSKLAKPDVVFVNPLLLPKMAQQADQKMRYDMESVNGVDVGFAGFTAVLPTGKCDILGEPSMPVTQMLLTKSGSWEMGIPGGGQILVPATNNKLIVDDYGDTSGKNQSRCTVMAGPGFFGCNQPSSSAMITVGVGTGLNL